MLYVFADLMAGLIRVGKAQVITITLHVRRFDKALDLALLTLCPLPDDTDPNDLIIGFIWSENTPINRRPGLKGSRTIDGRAAANPLGSPDDSYAGRNSDAIVIFKATDAEIKAEAEVTFLVSKIAHENEQSEMQRRRSRGEKVREGKPGGTSTLFRFLTEEHNDAGTVAMGAFIAMNLGCEITLMGNEMIAQDRQCKAHLLERFTFKLKSRVRPYGRASTMLPLLVLDTITGVAQTVSPVRNGHLCIHSESVTTGFLDGLTDTYLRAPFMAALESVKVHEALLEERRRAALATGARGPSVQGMCNAPSASSDTGVAERDDDDAASCARELGVTEEGDDRGTPRRRGARDRQQTELFTCGVATVCHDEPEFESFDSDESVPSDSDCYPAGCYSPVLSGSEAEGYMSTELRGLTENELSFFEDHDSSRLSPDCSVLGGAITCECASPPPLLLLSSLE